MLDPARVIAQKLSFLPVLQTFGWLAKHEVEGSQRGLRDFVAGSTCARAHLSTCSYNIIIHREQLDASNSHHQGDRRVADCCVPKIAISNEDESKGSLLTYSS